MTPVRHLRRGRVILLAAATGLALGLAAGCTKGPAPEPQAGTGGAPADADKLQGEWAVVSVERRGSKVPEDTARRMKVTIRGDTLMIDDGRGPQTATFRLDPGSTPRALDLIPAPEENEPPAPGIYELAGDTLRLCWDKGRRKAATGRPKEFATSRDSDLILMVLKRGGAPAAATP